MKKKISLTTIHNHKICSTFIKHFPDKITMVCGTIELTKSNISINLVSFASDFIHDSNFIRNYIFSDFYTISYSIVYNLIMLSSSTSSNNSIPLGNIKNLDYILVPYYYSIGNFSLCSCNYLTIFEHTLANSFLINLI